MSDCPKCGGAGYYVIPIGANGEVPEQVQCECGAAFEEPGEPVADSITKFGGNPE